MSTMTSWSRLRRLVPVGGRYCFCSLARLDDPDGSWLRDFYAEALGFGFRALVEGGHLYLERRN